MEAVSPMPVWLTELVNNTPFVIAIIAAIVLPIIVWRVMKTDKQQSLHALQQQTAAKHAEQYASLNEQKVLAEQALAMQKAASEHALHDKTSQLAEANAHIKSLQQSISSQDTKLGELQQKSVQLAHLQQQYQQSIEESKAMQQQVAELSKQQEAQSASFIQERKAFEEKLILLKDAEKQLNTQFENVANKIFEQKAQKFTETSQSGITQLLSPLKTQIDDFKRQISDQYIKEGQERAVLKTEILSLKALNQQITEEASALTNALKGDNKQQGNWGEVVLSRILNESGLREGHEYEVQKHLVSEAGKNYRPDVVIHLPNDKDIVVDSKVSLVAHERVVNAPDDSSRKQALKDHVASVKGHIKGLSKKDYQDLEGVKTLDYVLMFVPIEAAFLNAVEAEPELIKLALDNQIMLVSPTNLLVALRTINNIWQYEYQNQHAKTIADKAKRMYDKFVGFVEDMEKVGKNIDMVSKNYDAAMNKLSTGKGNLIGQAESFKALGVTPNKQIKKEWLPLSDDDIEDTSEQG
ncbi:MAG: DNA recombination protein RmuC [Glaciecola sp.]